MGGNRNAPAALSLGKRHGPHCSGDWVVGPRVGLEGYGGEKIFFLQRICRKSRLSDSQPKFCTI